MSNTNPGRKFTVEEIEYALKVSARVVAMYGDTYLPIFKRIHDELEKAREEEKTKQLAMNIAIECANS